VSGPRPEAHDPELACAAALAGLPHMGPARLRALLNRPATQAWRRVVAGRPEADRAVARALGPSGQAVVAAWRDAARGLDPARVLAEHLAAGVSVTRPGRHGYPAALEGDPDGPAVLFGRGALNALDHPLRVAVVGTRRCSATGASVAAELGRDLARAGVAVVSGLALGIDGAAHAGALEADGGARPVAVVGSGLDVVYPTRHRDLWRRVAEVGAVVSEAPLGARPEPWRFPARNRVIAALAQVVVVVESHRTGGSLHTVDQAAERGIPVLATPGSVRNPAAEGTNQLLHDGCAPARGIEDVLDALAAEVASPSLLLSESSPARGSPAAGCEGSPPPDSTEAAVLAAIGGEAAVLEQLAARTALELGQLAEALDSLAEQGLVVCADGWYEQVRP
jgi:DNA processing protein